MTIFCHVHDGDFEIRRNEPKLIIGVHFLKKNAKTREKSCFSTIGEAVDYVIKTHLLSCKIRMFLQDSCKIGILIHHLARFALSCKIIARLASACKKLAGIPCFVRNLQD